MLLLVLIPPHRGDAGGVGGVLTGKVVNSKVGELEEEVRELFLRRLSKLLAGVVQLLSGKKRFLVRFQGGCKKDMTSN